MRKKKKSSRGKTILLFIALLCYIYFRGIGDHGLIDTLEGVNASVSLHMFATGNYFTPKIGEALTAGSSLGTWWLEALALKFFGWGEFAVRFWSAISGLGMILASALAAHSSPGDSSRKSWFAASICASMTVCFVVSQLASEHALFAFLTALTMAGAVRARNNRRWIIISHIASTLAFISHGAGGLFLPWFAVIIYCVISNDWDLLRDFFTWPSGIIITIVFCGFYFILLALINPSIIHFMRCQGHNYTFGGTTGIIIFAFMSFFPFHGFILRAIYEVFPRKIPAEKSPEFLMFIWALTFGTAAVASGDILALASCVPALSAIIGRKLDLWLAQKKLITVSYSVVINTIILVPVFYMILPFMMNKIPLIRASMMSLIPYALTAGLFIFACWHYTKTREINKWVRNVPAAALLCLFPLAGVFNLTADLYSIREQGLRMREVVQGNNKVIQYGVNFPSVYFYTFRNSNIINAGLTPGVSERNFAADNTLIHSLWPGQERVFVIMRENMQTENVIPKNIYTLLEANGILLFTNQ